VAYKALHHGFASAVDNLEEGLPILSRFEIDFGPLLLTYYPQGGNGRGASAKRLRAQLLPGPTLAIVKRLAAGASLDTRLTLRLGTPVFRGSLPEGLTGLADTNVITLLDDKRTRALSWHSKRWETSVQFHELVHTFRYRSTAHELGKLTDQLLGDRIDEAMSRASLDWINLTYDIGDFWAGVASSSYRKLHDLDALRDHDDLLFEIETEGFEETNIFDR